MDNYVSLNINIFNPNYIWDHKYVSWLNDKRNDAY